MSSISIKQLLEAGVHFGHQTSRWNPKMKEFIFGERNGIHIVDLQQTLKLFKEAVDFLYDLGSEGKEVLFVGTKRQAQEAIEEDAKRCGMHFVTNRWLGGLLTNFLTIRNSIKRYKLLESMKADGSYKNFSKKEVAKFERERKKLEKNLRGIREMDKLPDSVFIIDTDREAIAVKEASRLGIPVIGVVDTNCNPDLIDFVIPGNDDALRSVKLFTSTVSDAIQAGRSVWEAQMEEERRAKEEAEKVEAAARVARDAARAARRAEAKKLEAAKLEAKKVEAAKVKAERVEAAKGEAKKVEAAKGEAKKVEAAKVGPEAPETKEVEAPAVAEEKVVETGPEVVEKVKPKAEKAAKKAKTKDVAEKPSEGGKELAAPEDAVIEAEPVEEKPKVEASEEQPEQETGGVKESEEAAKPPKKAEEKKPAKKRTVKAEAKQEARETVQKTASPTKGVEEVADSAEAAKTDEESKAVKTVPPKKKVAKKAAPRKSTTKRASTTKSKASVAKKSSAKKEASKDAAKTADKKSAATADDVPK